MPEYALFLIIFGCFFPNFGTMKTNQSYALPFMFETDVTSVLRLSNYYIILCIHVRF